MNKLILVLYVDVSGVDLTYIDDYVKYVGRSLFTEEVILNTGALTFVIPVKGGGTKIECINPKYIIDHDLYESHIKKLEEINKNIDHFMTITKTNKQ